MKINFYWHNYKYFLYEKELAIRELEVFFQPLKVEENNEYVQIEVSNFSTEHRNLISRLTYFRSVCLDGKQITPIQHLLENTQESSSNKQVTRYAAHGIHEYKGKFNPQIVRSISNILNLDTGSKVIDPFSGSGTTIFECAIQNIEAIGLDINPLAVMIGNAKQTAMKINPENLIHVFQEIKQDFEIERPTFEFIGETSQREEYLLKWLPLETFKDLELLKKSIEEKAGNLKDIFYILLSNLIRDYSLQEPADLRIRRRVSPFPETLLIDAFQNSVEIFADKIQSAQQVLNQEFVKNKVLRYDSRLLNNFENNPLPLNYFDAGITSPPYATALPYIDTQRISLVWLSLVNPKEVMALESELIGSREFKKVVKTEWLKIFFKNESNLTKNLFDYCMTLQNSLKETDGFRRQAVPVLLYRYLVDMKLMFANLLPHFKVGGKYALVVGHNQTTLGGIKYDINTPELLVEVAKSVGWAHKESIELQTYQRYGIHHKNAVKNETLIILERP